MKKIPTAEEQVSKWTQVDFIKGNDRENIKSCMIEFAKLHVKAALEAASRLDLESTDSDGNDYEEAIKNDILNAYPEINIK